MAHGVQYSNKYTRNYNIYNKNWNCATNGHIHPLKKKENQPILIMEYRNSKNYFLCIPNKISKYWIGGQLATENMSPSKRITHMFEFLGKFYFV